MTDVPMIFALLQAVSTGLILVCLWFARTLWSGQRRLEKQVSEHSLEVQKEIAAVRLETTTRIVALEYAAAACTE